ncbi:MAG: hypothetical protein J6A22_04580 [Bacteroidales bacterium]|nr:hypothetical protein [Bacteroidales bacterium]
MKKYLYFLFYAIVLSSCFRPEDTPQKSRHDLLCGYWEVEYVQDDDYNYEIFRDGSFGPTETYHFQGYITPNDGNEEYAVIHIDHSYIRLMATDCPDDIEMIGKLLKYDFVDDCLYGIAFNYDYTNFAKVTRLDSNFLEIYIEDVGMRSYDSVSDNYDNPPVAIYENMKRTIRYRRIQ